MKTPEVGYTLIGVFSDNVETASADWEGLAVYVAVFVAVGVTSIACHIKENELPEPEESVTDAKYDLLGPRYPGVVIKMNNVDPEAPTDEADTIGTALEEMGQKILPSAVPAE